MNKLKMRPHGFTLIELMIAIAVLGILLGIGIPNFSQFILKHRIRSVSIDLIAAYQWTRYESVKRGEKVLLCGTVDGANCSLDWSNKLLAFVDNNNNKKVDPTEIIRALSITNPPGKIRTKVGNKSRYIPFFPDGRVIPSGSLILCTPNNLDLAKEMLFNLGGRPYWTNISHAGTTLIATYGARIPCT